MELEVKKPFKLEDGKHEGVVKRVEYREKPYEYTDVVIEEKVSGFDLKYGAPTALTKNSKLGKLLAAFTELIEGEKQDPEKVLVGKKVQFLTVMEKTDKGEFVRIVEGSIKPLL